VPKARSSGWVYRREAAAQEQDAFSKRVLVLVNDTDEEHRAAWERLLRHAGAVRSGEPHCADNDRIDADLARDDF